MKPARMALHKPAAGPYAGPNAMRPNASARGSATIATVKPARRFGTGSRSASRASWRTVARKDTTAPIGPPNVNLALALQGRASKLHVRREAAVRARRGEGPDPFGRELLPAAGTLERQALRDVDLHGRGWRLLRRAAPEREERGGFPARGLEE